jgi:ketosteroid isomerase-like protein
MSQENAEIVRGSVELFRAEGLDAWLERVVASDAVLVQDAEFVEAQTSFGWEGWRTTFAAWTEEWDDYSMEFHEVIGVGDGRVVVTYSDRGRGRHSGAAVEGPHAAFVHTLKGGKIVHTVIYGRADAALEAVGLRG